MDKLFAILLAVLAVILVAHIGRVPVWWDQAHLIIKVLIGVAFIALKIRLRT